MTAAPTQAETEGPFGVCPYCGATERMTDRCSSCGGRFDPLSRQATQNAMGPWFIRDEKQPYRPGCSFETLAGMVARGTIKPDTVLRGPSTHQFWLPARRTPGVATLLGMCHACSSAVEPGAFSCRACGAHLQVDRDRQHLGLGPVRELPSLGNTAPSAPSTSAQPVEASVVETPSVMSAVTNVPTAGPVVASAPMPAVDAAPIGRRRRSRRSKGISAGALWLVAFVCLGGGGAGVWFGRDLLNSSVGTVAATQDAGSGAVLGDETDDGRDGSADTSDVAPLDEEERNDLSKAEDGEVSEISDGMTPQEPVAAPEDPVIVEARRLIGIGSPEKAVEVLERAERAGTLDEVGLSFLEAARRHAERARFAGLP